MRQNDVTKYTRRQPFRPFQIWLTDATTYVIRHPEEVSVGLSAVDMEFLPKPGEEPEEPTTVSLVHIIRIRNLKVPSSPTPG
jgi:hypothetical protein